MLRLCKVFYLQWTFRGSDELFLALQQGFPGSHLRKLGHIDCMGYFT